MEKQSQGAPLAQNNANGKRRQARRISRYKDADSQSTIAKLKQELEDRETINDEKEQINLDLNGQIVRLMGDISTVTRHMNEIAEYYGSIQIDLQNEHKRLSEENASLKSKIAEQARMLEEDRGIADSMAKQCAALKNRTATILNKIRGAFRMANGKAKETDNSDGVD